MNSALEQAKNSFLNSRFNVVAQLKALGPYIQSKINPQTPPNYLPTPDPWVQKGWIKAGGGYYQPSKTAGEYAFVDQQKIPAETLAKLKGTPVVNNRVPTALPSPQASPAPTTAVAQAAQAISDIVRGRAPINQATLSSRAKQYLPDLDKAIDQATKKFPVDKNLMYDIAFAESSWDPKLSNEINAQGWYQFTPNTWQDVLKYANDPNSSLYGQLPSTDPFDPYANAMAAAYLINHGQLGKWDASEWNWGGRYDLPKEIEGPGYYKQSVYHIPGMRASVRLAPKEKAKD